MKICFVSREVYPFQRSGGIGVYIRNMVETLLEQGHSIYLLTAPENEYSLFKEDEEYAWLSKVKIFNVKMDDTFNAFPEYRLNYSLAVYRKLKELAAAEQFDLVEFSDYFGESFFSVAYKKARREFENIPFVMKLHTPTYECNVANQLKHPESSLSKQEDYAIQQVDYVYAISHFMKKTIADRLNRTDIEVVYNMIDMPDRKMGSIDEHLVDKRYVLYVGKLSRFKGTDLFIDAAVKYLQKMNGQSNILFAIVGTDTLDELTGISTEELIKDKIPENYAHHFLWIGSVPQSQLVAYYENALFSVFPSRFEGFGNVCIEAMSKGSPVLVSSGTALEELVDYGNYGKIFENSNADSLANQLESMLDDMPYLERMKQKVKARAQQFSPGNLYGSQFDYYEKILEGYRSKKLEAWNNQVDAGVMALLMSVDSLYQYQAENRRLQEGWNHLDQIVNGYREEIKQLHQSNSKIYEELKETKNSAEHTIERLMEEVNHSQKTASEWEKESHRILKEWEKAVEQVQELTQELQKYQIDTLSSSNEENKESEKPNRDESEKE